MRSAPLLLLGVLPLAGCGAVAARPLTLEVRDGLSGEPVGGAVVTARSLHFFLPAPPFWIIDSSTPPAATGLTDADGRASLTAVVGRPVLIEVLAGGYEPFVADVEGSAGGWRSAPQRGAAGAGSSVRRLEVRVRD
jgi:hypothetical protein